jgi:gliding motility-associated-like protein
MKKFIAFAVLLTGIQINGFCQTVDYVTPEEAVALLLGNGVTATNITFTGSQYQIGHLSGYESTIFTVGDGVILSSDDVTAVGPNPQGNFFTGTSGDPDLLDVANSVPPLIGQSFSVSSVNDMSILEFDFVPTGDSLQFTYTFGSDEYLTYVNSAFNDVFAFFLSGPGITGPYDSPIGFPDGAINIAYVPDSDPQLPITISSVNNVLNSEFYIDNPGNVDISLNGFTATFVAKSEVICGETYHIKLAIADGTDTILESVVVLEAGSFSTSNSIITAYVPEPAPGQSETEMLEDCGIVGTFIIVPPACQTEPDTLQIIYSGTADETQDFTTNISGELIIYPDVPDTIFVYPVDDDLVEGTETITISFIYTNNQGVVDTAFATLELFDYINMTLAPIEPLFICPGSDAEATAIPINGFAPFEYTWTSGGDQESETYVEGQAGNYMVTVSDYCGSEAFTEFMVHEPTPFVPVDSINACVGLHLSFKQFGGAQPYIYEYDTLQFSYLDGDDAFIPLVAGHYYITVTDQCGQEIEVDIFADVCDTMVPTIFTPNSDGENDFFEIYGLEAFSNSHLVIHNRWGNVVFESTNYNNKWDGEGVPDGTYYWLFERSDGLKQAGYLQIVRETK